MIGGLEIAASYGPKSALVLDEPVSKHGSETADRLVMTFCGAVQRSRSGDCKDSRLGPRSPKRRHI
jgi:hypothetical protein